MKIFKDIIVPLCGIIFLISAITSAFAHGGHAMSLSRAVNLSGGPAPVPVVVVDSGVPDFTYCGAKLGGTDPQTGSWSSAGGGNLLGSGIPDGPGLDAVCYNGFDGGYVQCGSATTSEWVLWSAVPSASEPIIYQPTGSIYVSGWFKGRTDAGVPVGSSVCMFSDASKPQNSICIVDSTSWHYCQWTGPASDGFFRAGWSATWCGTTWGGDGNFLVASLNIRAGVYDGGLPCTN